MITLLVLVFAIDGALTLLVAQDMIRDWWESLPSRVHRRACAGARILLEKQGVHTSFAGWSGAHIPR